MDASTYVDFDLLAELDAIGGILMLSGSDALYNSLTEWLTSSKNQYLRNPNTGGILVGALDKTMTDERAEQIRNRLIEGLTREFTPSITVIDVKISPDHRSDTWGIEIIGYVTSLKMIIRYQQSFKGA